MKTHIWPVLFLLVLSVLCVPQGLSAQAEPEAANVLEFQSRRSPVIQRVRAGGKFGYSLHGSNRIFRGRLDEIRDTSLVIDGFEIGLSQFHMMEARNSKKQQKAGALLLWATALMLLAVGGIIYTLLLNPPGSGGPGGGTQVIGLLIAAVAFYLWQILFVVGSFMYTFGRKRFDLKRYWDVKIKQPGAKE